ncbi:MAG TPA: 16S rRNA (guanine(966)-N(2))-methyltransferase RsmD [Terriglobia bacterium]|nr:16S rRNA (guanine(966)-N(2))-methyltransferase RsmD [Terriglobia bacterium]
MHVIAGIYRGMQMKTLKGDRLRPTSDQLRKTLFDVLGAGVAGSRFLDAYAGSGAVGIEAFSRGAKWVAFMEHHRPAVKLIRTNLESLGIEEGFEILPMVASTALERLAQQDPPFDFVFLDPPYAGINEYHHFLRMLGRSTLLHAASQVIAEHSRHCFLEEHYGPLTRTRLLRHGDSQLAFYRLRANDVQQDGNPPPQGDQPA